MARVVDVARRTLVEARADNVTGEAAKVAFYLFLSLFPLLLVLFSLTGLIGGDEAFEVITGRLEAVAPAETAEYLSRFVRQVTGRQRPEIFSLGLVLTLWAASGGFAAFGDGLNAMYGVHETRSWWRKRAIALGLLVVGVFLLIGGAGIVLAGPAIIRALGLSLSWEALRWPIAFGLVVALLWLIYMTMPNREQAKVKRETLIGATAGASLWLLVTAGFRYYVSTFGRYGEMYGFVGAVIVLMLWLYLTALATLLGGEVAVVLERGERARRPALRVA